MLYTMFTLGGLVLGLGTGLTKRSYLVHQALSSVKRLPLASSHNYKSGYLPNSPLLWSLWENVVVKDDPIYMGNQTVKFPVAGGSHMEDKCILIGYNMGNDYYHDISQSVYRSLYISGYNMDMWSKISKDLKIVDGQHRIPNNFELRYTPVTEAYVYSRADGKKFIGDTADKVVNDYLVSRTWPYVTLGTFIGLILDMNY